MPEHVEREVLIPAQAASLSGTLVLAEVARLASSWFVTHLAGVTAGTTP